MYTSYIGQKFLDIYNRRTDNSYSAAAFFDKVMFPLFFDDARHLMTVHGSAFFQPNLDELKPENRGNLTENQARFKKMQKDIELAVNKTVPASAKILVGGPAEGPLQVTSGQITGLSREFTLDEFYTSWIGNALAVRVEGSQCLLLDSEPVLWHLFQGWEIYRSYMQPVKTMEGRQIETWNGYWLSKGELDKPSSPILKGGKLDTSPWVEVIAKLLYWHSGEVLPIYIFSLGNTNTTYGFINLHLPQLKRLSEARHAIKKTLQSTDDESDDFFWENYKPEFKFEKVIELGEIGLRGLRPKEYSRMMEESFSRIKIHDKNCHTFSNIQTWIIAMLNNKSELQKLAVDLAKEIISTEQNKASSNTRRVKADYDSSAILEAKGLVSFVNALATFIENNNEAKPVAKNIVDYVIRIPLEQFPLFKALIRFEYIFQKNNK